LARRQNRRIDGWRFVPGVPKRVPSLSVLEELQILSHEKAAHMQRFLESPLTDSNRRPPPYHRATRRDPRAKPGLRGHGSPAGRRNRPKTSDLTWTPV